MARNLKGRENFHPHEIGRLFNQRFVHSEKYKNTSKKRGGVVFPRKLVYYYLIIIIFIVDFFLAIIPLYQWLTCYLLQKTYNKLENELQQRKDLFWAKNDNQVFYAKNLSIAFIQVV